ncbi:unnamed protein product, partial [Mesorhabditis belari]|uniref:Replication factor C subunit 1 n=1 Tax=Mesorhabditis belari TaxID=2138241 RepID=A0AAF3ESW7_9BILA
MSGIQRFFGKTPKAANPSASQASTTTDKKRPASRAQDNLTGSLMEFEDSDGEGEHPIPRSVRRQAQAHAQEAKADEKAPRGRRRKAVLASDSDDEDFLITSQPAKATPKKKNPVAPVKRARFEDDRSPQKGPTKNTKQIHLVDDDDEDELVSVTDSEDEFREKKKPKKALPPGQTKLNFEKKTKQSEPVKGNTQSKKTTDAASFFGDAPRQKAPARGQSKNVAAFDTKYDDILLVPNKKDAESKSHMHISPSSQKENFSRKTENFVQMGDEVYEIVDTLVDIPHQNKRRTPVISSPSKPVNLSVTVSRPDLPLAVPWVDKYKPQNPQELIGMNGDKSPWNKLIGWLRDWAQHNLGEAGRTKKPRPPPWMAGQEGSAFKAVLLSGPPGIGKTTCAKMACESLGFQTVEMNASDVRNKKHLEAHVAQLTGSHQLEEYFGATKNPISDVRHVLIMDEVDGMSGNEDRSGISELMDIIKNTMIPIICICNDRAHPKMRTLVNYCFDVRFQRPRVEHVRSRIMMIAVREKLRMSKEDIDEIIELSNHDVRQCIYNLQMRKAIPEMHITQKDVTINAFEAARRLLSKSSTLREKQEMFFVDYGIMPLFVFENYLHLTNNERSKVDHLASIRRAAEFIAMGDMVDKQIRSGGAWKLLNEQSMLSAALPSMAMDGHLKTQILFPAWLGKNSTAGKRLRLTRQIAQHSHLRISGDTCALVTDYIPALRTKITRPLIDHENLGVPEVVATFVEYDLIRDDADAIAELAVWPGRKDPGAAIAAKTKAALTRALTKEHRVLPYALDDVGKGKKRGGASDALEVEIDEEGFVVERGGAEGEEEQEETEESNDKQEAAGGNNAGGSSLAQAARGRAGWRGGPPRGRGSTVRGGRGGRGRGK